MADTAPNDAALVSRARSGSNEAFAELVIEHQDEIYNAIYRLVGNRQDAEDLAQDVFLKAYDNLGSFRGEAKFRTWLFGIMLNTVRNFWRRTGRRAPALSLDKTGQEGKAGPEDPPSPHDGPLAATLRAETVARVQQAIESLDDEFKEILVLRDIQGLSYDELAEVLALPAGTVKSRLYRARMDLKGRLEPFFEDENET